MNPHPCANLSVKTLEDHGESLESFDGLCGDLCDAVLHRHEGKILYIEIEELSAPVYAPSGMYWWSYHMTPIIDGVVHDAWFPEAMLRPKEFVDKIFPGSRWEVYG